MFLLFWVTVSIYLFAGAKLENTNRTVSGFDKSGGSTTAEVYEIVADNQVRGILYIATR